MSKKAASSFGQPKPLPGQAGYKVSATEQLEKESTEMEIRLKMLQERIKQQQQADTAEPKKGGSRWRSARTDKGSVTAYAKDVQERHKSRMTEAMNTVGLSGTVDPALMPSIRIPSGASQSKSNSDKSNNSSSQVRSNSSESQRVSVSSSYKDKVLDDWSIGDVVAWLDDQNLGQYAAGFVSNEISGPILLDLSLEDLDYMGMTVLGHRKIILRSIEDLRANNRVTKPLLKASGSSSPDKNLLRSQTTDDMVGGNSVPPKQQTGTVHWSHLEPLSTREIPESKYDGMAVNAADSSGNKKGNGNSKGKGKGGVASYGDDILDEEAEREAFRLAVLEWRASGTSDGSASQSSSSSSGDGKSKVKIIREWEQKSSSNSNDNNNNNNSGKAAANESLWHNPFSAVPSSLITDDDDDDIDAINNRRSTTNSSSNNNNNSNSAASPRAAAGSATGYASSPRAASRLADGELNEEAEHAEFVRAVESWRTGKPVVAASVQSTVQRLQTELEIEQQAIAERLASEKEAALSKFAELSKQRAKVSVSAAIGTSSALNDSIDDELQDLEDLVDHHLSDSQRAYNASNDHNNDYLAELSDEEEDAEDADERNVTRDNDADEDEAFAGSYSFVDVQLVKTERYEESKNAQIESQQEYYVVESEEDES